MIGCSQCFYLINGGVSRCIHTPDVVVEVSERIVQIDALGDFSPAESAGGIRPRDAESHRSHNAVVKNGTVGTDENGTAENSIKGTLSGFNRSVL